MKHAAAILALGALVLAGCAGGGGAPRLDKRTRALIDQTLSTAPGGAQPSTIVALEVAFGRLAAETTPAAAFLQYAASGAQANTPKGLIPVEDWVQQSGFPARAAKWSTRAVAMACDGALAASTGRFTDADGIIGNYVVIWQRQDDGAYRWAYHAAGPDVPQPPPRSRQADGDIVVSALDAVQGLVASCPRGDGAIPAPPAISIASDAPGNASLSRDGTLRWRWQQEDGGRMTFVAADYFYEGRWLSAFEHNLASGLDQ